MKTIKIGVILLAITLFMPLFSCLDLDKLNEDPNNPVKVSSNYILPYVLSKTALYYKSLGNYNSQVAGAMQYVQVGTNESSWKINHYNWDKGSWDGFYDVLRNIQMINGYALESKNPFFEAISLIFRAAVFGVTTDVFGDIPYAESLKAKEGLYFPKYDEQKYIYKGILEDLNKAEALLAQPDIATYKVTPAADLMYAGNAAKWRKFCNSLRLRYAMRLYDKKNDMSALGVDIIAIFNDAAGKAFTAVDDDALVKYIGTTPENSAPGGKLNSSNPPFATKPCATLVDKLQSISDPRLYRWVMPVAIKWDLNIAAETDKTVTTMFGDSYTVKYLPTTNSSLDTSLYVGLPMGLAVQDAMNYNKGSYSQTFNAERSPFISYMHGRYRENTDPLLRLDIMDYSEVEFLLAEAAFRGGFSVAGTAESHYRKGIEASMARWGIIDGKNGFSFNAYYSNPGVDYAAAANKLERIMEQKWLAGWLNVEPWFDWRRTGYPDLKPGPVASYGPAIPIRMAYPVPNSDEKYMVNYNEAVGRLEATVFVPAGQSKDHVMSKIWVIQGTGKPY